MLDLVVIACLMADPARCDQVYLATLDQTRISECKLAARQQVETWAAQHRDITVVRWTCKPALGVDPDS